jgi:hypothetical protein
VRIVYYLMTHKNNPQIERLVTCLHSSENSYVLIHHDAKSVPLNLRTSKTIHILDDPVSVQWGEISVVQAMWKGIEWIQQTTIPFDWMIFLSGSDYPVRPMEKIEAELQKTNMDAFLHYELIHENPELHERYFHTLCMRRYFQSRFKIPGMRPLYLKRKHPYVNGIRCYAGSQWFNLSHRAIEYLWTKRDFVFQLMHYLRAASCPDETIFQTVLMNNPLIAVENSNKRYIEWRDEADSPELLCVDHLKLILSSEAWFARKVDDEVCPELLDRLDDIILYRV